MGLAVAWGRIKATAAEQRQLWREVGEALNYGRALHPSNQGFGKWCAEQGFDMHTRYRSASMWLATNWDSVRSITPNVTDPIALQAAHREAQVPASEELKQVAPQPAVKLEPRDAQRVVKTMHRAESGDEGADIAARPSGEDHHRDLR